VLLGGLQGRPAPVFTHRPTWGALSRRCAQCPPKALNMVSSLDLPTGWACSQTGRFWRHDGRPL
jgi:hypothetical protein